VTVPAHVQAESHHYVMHFPPHPARADDPHYADFDHYHRKTRATARCYIGERIGFGDCKDAQCKPCPPPEDGGEQPGLELHHAHVEFSLQNGVDLAALEKDYPGISDPSQVGAWVESEANFRWLCVAEGSPVLMADGTTRPIEYVLPGEQVIGRDGLPHLVEVTSRKRYRGELVSFGCASFTPEHRILSHRGWLSAAHVFRQVWMHGPDVIALRCEQNQIRSGVVGAVPVEVVNALSRQQRAPYPVFHDHDVLHAMPAAVPDADVALRGDPGRPVADVPLRELVQLREAALVGAVAPDVRAGAPVRRSVEGLPAGGASPEMGWVTAMPSRTAAFTGWVHDLSVAHSHSFVVGGIAAHNCAWHHRGAAGAHTASHSDWEASQYVQGLISQAAK